MTAMVFSLNMTKYNAEMAQLFSELLAKTVERYTEYCYSDKSEDSLQCILEDAYEDYYKIWEDFTRD
jgi:hypothetical protein